MKVFFTFIMILCVSSIIYGNYHWNHKLETSVDKNAIIIDNQQSTMNEVTEKQGELNLENAFSNLPTEVASFMQEKLDREETVEILLVGTDFNELGQSSWSSMFKKKIEDEYGTKINVSILEFGLSTTTTDLLDENLHKENTELVPDILLLEPFLLNDIGIVRIEDTLENITTLIDDFTLQNDKAFIFIQPSHPVYDAIYYPQNVKELELYSEQNGFTYINHWENWPDYQSEEVKSYLMPGSEGPNEEGHRVWAEYLSDLFINKTSESE